MHSFDPSRKELPPQQNIDTAPSPNKEVFEHTQKNSIEASIPTDSKKLEQESGVEVNKEVSSETEKDTVNKKIETLGQKLRSNKKKKNIIPTIKDEMTLRVEKIMEEGLAEAFQELTPIQQQEFKIKGEETAWKIRQLLKKTHIKVRQIFKLLTEWLRFLPGINKFFIEQEAKIKADKILSLKKHQPFI